MHGSWLIALRDKKHNTLRSLQSRCLKLFMNCSIKVHCFNSLELGDLLHAGSKVGVARSLLATIKSSKHENVDKSCPTLGTPQEIIVTSTLDSHAVPQSTPPAGRGNACEPALIFRSLTSNPHPCTPTRCF